MAHLIISILWILVAVALLVGLYYVIIWVFEQLGLPLPAMAVKIGFIVIGLLVLIWLISAIFGGGGMVLTVPR
jgi:hypothetical protein